MEEELDLMSAPAVEQMVPLSAVQKMIADAIKAAQFGPGGADDTPDVIPGEPPPGCSGKKRTIIIEDVEGLPNFEVIGINGHVLKIMRGEEVEIWEECVEILKHAVSTFEPTLTEVQQGHRAPKNRNLIPWRLVR